jgi:uncharacterized protein YbjT (DUF2867 family)
MIVLVTGATGMFGSRVAREAAARGARVRALVRAPARTQAIAGEGIEPVVADLDTPETLRPALEGVERVFVVTPMDPRSGARQVNVIEAAREAGVRLIVLLHGAVRHHDDILGRQHEHAMAVLRASGTAWTLFSPQTVMETNLEPQFEAVRQTGGLWGCAGDGRAAMVAADDCGRAGGVVLTTDGHAGREYFITGPVAISYADVAREMSGVLGREVVYHDVPEDQFRDMLVERGMTAEEAEIGVLAHFRAFKRGDAELVTDDYERLTGLAPTSLRAWLEEHAAALRA